MIADDIKLYLPKYLSSESERELFEGLKDFPNNIDERLYTNHLSENQFIYQGDGLHDLLVVNLPDPTIKAVPCMILSNSCDIDLGNERNFPSQIVYAPIFKLDKYCETLYGKSKKKREQIDSHIEAIRQQLITQIFYLPQVPDVIDDSIVFLDRVCNFPNKSIERDKIRERRLFTLSDYGSYLFVLKLSIHFTRIQDKVERKSTRI
ncbi:MAG: hypothetical protein DRH08_02745 [Deltaproteobacteria bacterium]|nr:MAG: hypothetical protein DRH08_02745 [Deltaproteobacteria bacterium]